MVALTSLSFPLSFPVWGDPDYAWARSPAERLMAAGIEYARERPPRGYLKQYASWLDRKIVYVPLGSLSPQRLKKLRVMHILWGKDKRDIAGEYVW